MEANLYKYTAPLLYHSSIQHYFGHNTVTSWTYRFDIRLNSAEKKTKISQVSFEIFDILVNFDIYEAVYYLF